MLRYDEENGKKIQITEEKGCWGAGERVGRSLGARLLRSAYGPFLRAIQGELQFCRRIVQPRFARSPTEVEVSDSLGKPDSARPHHRIAQVLEDAKCSSTFLRNPNPSKF
jgi:hypothetical protein